MSSVRDTNEPGLSFHPAARRALRFGPFRIDLSDGSLWREDEEVRLPPRALGILLHLVERPGKVVSKADLIDAVWKDANVSETSLTEALGIVRQALGDNSQQPLYIQTVHRRGYRFIAPISIDASASGPRSLPDAPARGAIEAPDLPQLASAPQRARGIAAITVSTIAVAALLTATWIWWRADAAPGPVTRATITLPVNEAPGSALSLFPVMAISPNGEEMVYVAGGPSSNQLFVRRMDQFEARPLAGTQSAHAPFFSPDGTRVGFFSGRALKQVPLSGGEPVTVTTDARSGLGATWTREGTIIFAQDWTGGLLEVDANGGTPRMLLAPPKGAGYRWPRILPDGDTVIATRWRADQESAAIIATSRTRGGETVVLNGATAASYLSSGHLVFVRDGTLFVAGYTPGQPAGRTLQVLDGVMTSFTGAAQYAVSDNGSLVYVPLDETRYDRRLFEVSLDGRATPMPHEPRGFQEISVCGDKLAVSIVGRSGFDVWTGRLSGGALTRLTQTGSAMDPVWRPGCTELAYSSGNELYLQRGDGASAAVKLQDAEFVQAPMSWTPDGREVVYVEVDPKTRHDIWIFNLAEHRKRPLVRTPDVEWVARVSPDGEWLAYQSLENGRYEIHVRRLAQESGRIQVSPSGGTDPSWSPDGRTLYYVRKHGVEAVAIDRAEGVRSGSQPRRLFERPDMSVVLPLPGGNAFLVADRMREQLPLTTLNLIINWQAEIEKRLR